MDLGSPVALVARLGLAVVLGAGCGGSTAKGFDARHAAASRSGGLAEPGLTAPDDPTVRGARLVPASLDEARVWGAEPGGGVRAVVAGVRIVSSPVGDLVAATDRLPASPSSVVELPERLGGGFLMVLGPHLWRAPTWLETATPLFTLSVPIAEVLVGLDRVYLRSGQGALFAMDPRTGAGLDLGPLPASPRVGSVAALDAWRAVAVADLRGTLLTVDAGSSWRPVSLPIEPSRVTALGETFAVVGVDRRRAVQQWWEVLPDGQTNWLSSSPSPPPIARPEATVPDVATARPFGAGLLRSAIEDGWPLTDGTALLARDGFLARVRLADGVAVEIVPDAFALAPARCHPLSLASPSSFGPLGSPGLRTRAGAGGAFGFVCGVPRGVTAVFRWDDATSSLVELRRFESPREVLGSANGSLAVRGRCAPQGTDASPARDQSWCVMTTGGDWSEMHFIGEGVDRARIVVLSNGHVALIRPPEAGDLSTARLTLIDGVAAGARATHLPLRLQALPADAARALRFGIWMDGFEERRPGVLSGWVDAAGSILGIEIALDGEVRVGEYIRSAGAPIASGRWAFGWTASGSGFETTDGGMTWNKEIALPDPISEPRAGRDRACGPIGCVAAGWLRVGWGARSPAPSPEPPPVRPRTGRRPPSLTLECEPVGSRPPTDVALLRGSQAPPAPNLPIQAHRSRAGAPFGANAGAVVEFRPFAGRAAPLIPSGDLGLSADASNALDRGLRSAPLARGYAWGPDSGDWDSLGRWQIRWQWPWGGWTDVRSTAGSPTPWPTFEIASRTFGGAGVPPEWTLVPGDDADHALLIVRRGGSGLTALEALDADRPPVEIKRDDGESLPDIQGALRSGGRWYLATAQASGEPAAAVLWRVDGSIAQELGRVPRIGQDALASVRLARRPEGAAAGPGSPTSPASPVTVALAVAGQDLDRGALLWVSSFDPETRGFRDPELLAPFDLSDRPVAACTGDDGGWEIETSYPAPVDVRVRAGFSSRLQGVVARLRVSRGGACVDRLFGSAPSYGPRVLDEIWAGAVPRTALAPEGLAARAFDVSVLVESERVPLRCRQVLR
jgi:hypothetical protein